MLSVPTIATASSASPMLLARHPFDTSDRNPSSRYVTGFHDATTFSHPES